MGRLKDFAHYLEGRHTIVQQIEERLCGLQQKYETFFAEVSRVRESELGQLQAHIVADRGKLPPWLNEALDRTQVEVERELQQQLQKLREDLRAAQQLAEEQRQLSRTAEQRVREKNVELDAEEERLKARSGDLLRRIEEHNERIRQLSRGFGFFANLFQMRQRAAERGGLDDEQSDLAARIESVRARWVEREQEHVTEEQERQRLWVTTQTEAAALQAKIEVLEGATSQIVLQTTIERVLYERVRDPLPTQAGDPPCARCRAPNPAGHFFCQICAQRLQPDRPDLEGSIEEIAQVNLHHRRFSEGMRACQELIGLVRGLKTGVLAFCKSVGSVMDSESRYPLAKLQIDVPQAAVTFGESFDRLLAAVQADFTLHPKAFAEQASATIRDVWTEASIKGYFESMGTELSRQAKAQWR